MIKIKLIDLKSAEETLKKLSNTPLEIKLAYKIVKILKTLREESKNIEVMRNKIVEKLGGVDAKGNAEVPKDKIPEFVKEYSELLEQETEVDISLIPWQALKAMHVTPNDLIAIEKFAEQMPEDIKAESEVK